MKKNTLIFLLLMFELIAGAQTTMQVVSKNIEKTLPYRSGYELSIEGEKADVVIQAGNSNLIKVSVEITSKNPDLAVAKQDLEQVHFEAELQGRKVVIRNFLKPYANGKKPASSIKTKYLIVIPSECAVQLKNNFGKTNVSNLYNFLQMYTEFSQIGLNNLRGKVNVDAKFGDIYAKNIDADVKINARRTNITMSELKGNYQISMSYGKANISSNLEPINLNVSGDHADVLFMPFNKPYTYDLNTRSGTLDVPQNLSFSISDAGQNMRTALLRPQGQIKGIVTIKMNFGNIKVVN